jgi:hypothetical protein
MIRVVVAVTGMLCGAANACGNAGDTLATGTHYAVAWRTAPSAVAIGQHFAVDLTVCPLGKAATPRTVRVDASMPEHRHGMNYRTTVVARGPLKYRADGLLFHMSGRWEIAFDVVSANATERVTSSVVVE